MPKWRVTEAYSGHKDYEFEAATLAEAQDKVTDVGAQEFVVHQYDEPDPDREYVWLCECGKENEQSQENFEVCWNCGKKLEDQ